MKQREDWGRNMCTVKKENITRQDITHGEGKSQTRKRLTDGVDNIG